MYVERLPRPIPNNIKYWIIDGNTPINANGKAQHRPFTAFTDVGQLTLFFIRCRIIISFAFDFAKYAPKGMPNEAIHIIAYQNIG